MTYHFQTQPLPTLLAWYAHHLPVWLLRASCAGMFAIELLAPLCLPGPRAVRHAAAIAMIALQLVIAAHRKLRVLQPALRGSMSRLLGRRRMAAHPAGSRACAFRHGGGAGQALAAAVVCGIFGRRHLLPGGGRELSWGGAVASGPAGLRGARPPAQLQHLRPVRGHDGRAPRARDRGQQRRYATGASMRCPTSLATWRVRRCGSRPTSPGSTGSSGSRRSSRPRATPGLRSCARGC